MESVFRTVERLPAAIRARLFPAETDREEKEAILRELRAVSERIRCTQSRFDLVCDSELVDSCIYELEALNAKYRFLLRRARQLKLRCSPFSAAR